MMNNRPTEMTKLFAERPAESNGNPNLLGSLFTHRTARRDGLRELSYLPVRMQDLFKQRTARSANRNDKTGWMWGPCVQDPQGFFKH